MSRLVARILLTVFMLPAATLVYIFAFLCNDEFFRNSESLAFFVAGTATWCFIAAYWLLLWRGAIAWNARRIMLTSFHALAALMAGVIMGAVTKSVLRFSNDNSFGCFFGSMVAPLAWLILTVFAWRETPVERRERLKGAVWSALVCPNCGYNLTGLSIPRCPECGSQFTLDELMAAQPNHRDTDITV